ncbi:hypothetical protein [Ornithinimicrobium sp. Y1694]|uniref:hypothetical protein n=1 Tax=Ornithinimicrobium sp. Y1694 TaxID=3418590 RepID=UPI003CF06D0B
MRLRNTTITAALGLSLVLAGCSNGEDTTEPTNGETQQTQDEDTATGAADEDAATDDAATTDDAAATNGAAAAPMSDEICVDFFQTSPGVPLSERSDEARKKLENGEVTDPIAFDSVNLLSQRIMGLQEDAEGEQADLLERINAPFREASEAILDDPEKSRSDSEIELPDIDVSDSQAAQDEFEASCS